MNLYELSFTSYVYSNLTKFDVTYLNLLKKINYDIDLLNLSHRGYLLKWLNDWGCRNFYRECHELASNEILSWYKEYNDHLPPRETNMWELKGDQLKQIQTAHDNLKLKIASHIVRDGRDIKKGIGETGSAKILFSLRPKSLIPWDMAMRDYYIKNYGISTYSEFLLRVIDEICELKESCQKENFELSDIPRLLNKQNMTIPKFIDEYHWIRITNGFILPDNNMLKNWLKWNTINYEK